MRTQEAAKRIMQALYGKDVWYKAPELFEPGHRALYVLAEGQQAHLATIVEEVEERRREHDAKKAEV